MSTNIFVPFATIPTNPSFRVLKILPPIVETLRKIERKCGALRQAYFHPPWRTSVQDLLSETSFQPAANALLAPKSHRRQPVDGSL